MGCGGSKSDGGGAKNDNPEIDPIDVPDIDPNGPPPKPPDDMKKDIFKPQDYTMIDNKAKQMARTRPATYEALARTLTAQCKTDLQKARALFVWLFYQDIYGSWYSGVKDPYTPVGYMKLIKTRKGSYAEFYAQLCRAANIPCNVIRGVSKGATYEVGQETVHDMDGAWCTLYLENGWRFVHPLWAYFMEKEVFQGGQTPRPGTKRATIEEFFWLTDPTKMICFHKPDADPWQLLKSKWDEKKFMHSPRLMEDYFSSKLMLPKKYNAIIPTDTGMVEVLFDHQEFDDPRVQAEVEFIGDMSSDAMPEDVDMKKYIITAGSGTTKCAIIRCPVKGRYIADIYGGAPPATNARPNANAQQGKPPQGNAQQRKPPQGNAQASNALPKIVEFRIECAGTRDEPEPFPLNPDEGFGILPKASFFGISEIDPNDGIVYVKPGEQRTFIVKSSQNVEIDSTMFHNQKNSTDLENCMVVSEPGSTVTIDVTVPHEQHLEFGLQLAARPQNGRQNFEPVANFLLVDENWMKKTAVVRPTKSHRVDEERIRNQLIKATHGDDMYALENAIEEFEEHGLADKGDLTHAKHKLIEMHLDDLRRTTKARKLDPLEDAIKRAKNSVVASSIIHTKEMADAEAARRQLKRLRLYMHKVMELNKATISEIHSYQRPRPLVHKVMKATFRILGEPNRKLEKWPYIQSSMRKLGRESMIARMRRLDIVHVKEPQINDAEKHLSTTNKLLVRMCSAGAGTFYVWSNNMIGEYHGKGHTEPQNIWTMPKKHDSHRDGRSSRGRNSQDFGPPQSSGRDNDTHRDDHFKEDWERSPRDQDSNRWDRNQSPRNQNHAYNDDDRSPRNQDQDYGNQNQGYGNQNQGYGNQNQGYGNQNQDYGNQNQDDGNQNQTSENQNQPYGKQNGPYSDQNHTSGNQNQNYGNQNQNHRNQRGDNNSDDWDPNRPQN